MKKYLTRWRFLFLILFAAAAIFASYGLLSDQTAAQGTSKPLSGFAWSSNIGWIKASGKADDGRPYGVSLSGSTLIGKVWSSNIGWISFDSTAGTPPSGTAGASVSDGKVVGWARACSVLNSNCSGASGLKPDSVLGGWDGWIKLGDASTDCTSTATNRYGVCLNSDNQLDGFAWGSDVVGWVSFCADPTTGACVTLDNLNVPCYATDTSGVTKSTFNVGERVDWKATVSSGGTAPYTYDFCWGASCVPSLGGNVDGIENDVAESSVSIPGGYPSQSVVTANVKATQGGKSGQGSCVINIKDLNNPILTVSVAGIGDAIGNVSSNPDGNLNPNGDPGIDQCKTAGPTLCSNVYGLNDTVTLTATADAGYFFDWLGQVPASCARNVPDCPIAMNESKNVSIRFFDPSASQISLTVGPTLLFINSHNLGQTTISNKATITNNSNDTQATVCVQSFNSLIPDYRTIDTVVSEGANGNTSKVKCVFNSSVSGEKTVDCSDTINACTTIAPLGGTATFAVQMPELVRDGPRFLQNSPYRIVLNAGQTDTYNLLFKYRAGDIRP